MKLAELNLDIKNDLFSDHPEVTERIRLIQQYLEERYIYPTVTEDTSNFIGTSCRRQLVITAN
jgi:hypothetical protein